MYILTKRAVLYYIVVSLYGVEFLSNITSVLSFGITCATKPSHPSSSETSVYRDRVDLSLSQLPARPPVDVIPGYPNTGRLGRGKSQSSDTNSGPAPRTLQLLSPGLSLPDELQSYRSADRSSCQYRWLECAPRTQALRQQLPMNSESAPRLHRHTAALQIIIDGNIRQPTTNKIITDIIH